MKAESIDDASQFRYPCYVSEKLDGWRCLISDGTMFTSGGKEFKPPVQERFKLIVDSAKAAGLVLDGELFIEGNRDFGLLSSSLSASVEVMAERGLRFHCFDAVTHDEWHCRTSQEPFEKRYERYRQFQVVADYARDTGRDIFVAINQVLCKDEAAADAYRHSSVLYRGVGSISHFRGT